MRELCLLLLICLAAACDTFSGYTMKRDVDAMLSESGLKIDVSQCESEIRSRSGGCDLMISGTDVSEISEKLGLKSIESENEKHDLIGLKLSKCSATFAAANGVSIFKQTRKIVLANGSSFDRISLYYNAATNIGCLEVGYAFG